MRPMTKWNGKIAFILPSHGIINPIMHTSQYLNVILWDAVIWQLLRQKWRSCIGDAKLWHYPWIEYGSCTAHKQMWNSLNKLSVSGIQHGFNIPIHKCTFYQVGCFRSKIFQISLFSLFINFIVMLFLSYCPLTSLSLVFQLYINFPISLQILFTITISQ